MIFISSTSLEEYYKDLFVEKWNEKKQVGKYLHILKNQKRPEGYFLAA